MSKLNYQKRVSRLSLTILLVFSATSTLEATPEGDADIKLRDQMVQISKELGVTCTYCHNPQNFKDSKNKNFGVAREHIKITQFLTSDQGIKTKPKVSCFVCHRGKAKFDYSMGSEGGSASGL